MPSAGAEGAAGNKTLFYNNEPLHEIGVPKIVVPRNTTTGRFNYVVTEEGKLVIGKIDNQAIGGGHIDLAIGKPVRAAGEVTIVRGKVVRITNESGHYRPKGESAKCTAEKAFADEGMNSQGLYKEVY